MNGKEHLFATGLTYFLFLFAGYLSRDSLFFVVMNTVLSALSDTPYASMIILAFILLGSLLPDSDSVDRGSLIFYTPFAPIAYLIHFSEGWIAKQLGMGTGHRESLHTVKGIFLSSTIVVGFFWFSLMLFNGTITRTELLLSYVTLVFGQLLHLLQDRLSPTAYFLAIGFVLLGIVSIPSPW